MGLLSGGTVVCVRRIEVIVKMQKSRGGGGLVRSGVGGGGWLVVRLGVVGDMQH